MSMSVLISEPDHFRIADINETNGSGPLAAFQAIVGGNIETVSPDPSHWAFIFNAQGKALRRTANRPATRFADVAFVDAGYQPFSRRDYFAGTVIVVGVNGAGLQRDTPVKLITTFSDSALLDAHARTGSDVMISLIRIRANGDDAIIVFDQGDSRITDEVVQQVELARDRVRAGQQHGEIEVWSGLTRGRWQELRVDIMDAITITLSDRRDDRSYG